MKNSRRFLIISLALLATAIVLLATGSSFLTVALWEEPYIPWGTFITWSGIIALPASIYFGISRIQVPETKIERLTASILKGLITMAILWIPICYLLSGNLSFSFGEKEGFQGGQEAMQVFWYFNYFMAAAPLVLLILYKIFTYFKSPKDRPQKS